jgi:hypothetical protein
MGNETHNALAARVPLSAALCVVCASALKA